MKDYKTFDDVVDVFSEAGWDADDFTTASLHLARLVMKYRVVALTDLGEPTDAVAKIVEDIDDLIASMPLIANKQKH